MISHLRYDMDQQDQRDHLVLRASAVRLHVPLVEADGLQVVMGSAYRIPLDRDHYLHRVKIPEVVWHAAVKLARYVASPD